MKKLLLILSGALLTFTSCKKEEIQLSCECGTVSDVNVTSEEFPFFYEGTLLMNCDKLDTISVVCIDDNIADNIYPIDSDTTYWFVREGNGIFNYQDSIMAVKINGIFTYCK
jgi:hypothetical protein